MARDPGDTTHPRRRWRPRRLAESDAIPDDFVSFLARRVPGLRVAAHRLSGNDRLADSLVDELLTAIALRWHWLAFTEQRLGRQRAADWYLDRIFQREAATWRTEYAGGTGRTRLPSLRTSGERLAPTVANELAALHWGRGSRLRRRRRLVAAGIAGALLVAVFAVPGNRAPSVAEGLPALPSEPPPLVDVLPSFAEQARLPARDTALPDEIGLDPVRAATWQSSGQRRRAVAVFQALGFPPLVLGDDGSVRELDSGPPLADVWLSSNSTLPPLTVTSLSPDGTRIAFLANEAVVIVDLATVTARRYPALRINTAVVWLTPQTLLVAGRGGALVIDPRTGATAPTSVNAQHVLTGQGGAQPSAPPAGTAPSPSGLPPVAAPLPSGPAAPTPAPAVTSAGTALPVGLAEQVIELLPVGQPATAPARVRRYRLVGGVPRPFDIPLTGGAVSWLGPWRSAGFLLGGPGGRAVRDCDPGNLVLPAGHGSAVLATVVLHPNTGRVERTLVATSEATTLRTSMLLGWLDRDTALVRTSDGLSQHLLAWRVTDGLLALVSKVSREAVLSVADLVPRG